jgi:hypothetical protein
MQKTWEVWNSLLGKTTDSMTEVERHVNRVNIFVCDFENGSWLYNIAPGAGEGSVWTALCELATSVAAIGVPIVAGHLVEIAEILEQTDVQVPGTWEDYLAAADPKKRVAALYELISDELREINRKLEEFTLAHFECEGHSPGNA